MWTIASGTVTLSSRLSTEQTLQDGKPGLGETDTVGVGTGVGPGVGTGVTEGVGPGVGTASQPQDPAKKFTRGHVGSSMNPRSPAC
mmetsp:Transcript_11281/g.26144  ORF Transcript_11281/g.26144 Transcript_11281/m.26144 type:complete len:86 (+) Transcript_11281:158-415(+)